jgi:hypothetical protein
MRTVDIQNRTHGEASLLAAAAAAVHSCRCVLFELLAGRQAFDAPDMPGLVSMILAGTHQPMPAHVSWDMQVRIV